MKSVEIYQLENQLRHREGKSKRLKLFGLLVGFFVPFLAIIYSSVLNVGGVLPLVLFILMIVLSIVGFLIGSILERRGTAA
ncbi:hypothetical protein H8D91_01395 [archaeon]|nr:hypothetical protein [archaeon]